MLGLLGWWLSAHASIAKYLIINSVLKEKLSNKKRSVR
jgi:hypothetical protein